MTDPVAAQYEALPYPARDPRDERKRLIVGSPSHLDEVNHYVFGGRLDFALPFRALVAGGGTGDATVMLAQQIADRGLPGEVVQLDMSRASRRIAEARVAARGLTNVRFVTGSLLDVGEVAPGPYDYIDCCGVLHHLEDPGAGLRALVEVLAPHGGLGLMVYGMFGRAGVYEVQDLLRRLAPIDEAPEARLAMAKRLVPALPSTNPLVRNPFVRDHVGGGDAGLYDLLLHPRDRAYRVDDVHVLCDEAGLTVLKFIEPCAYDPATYVRDPHLRRVLTDLPPRDRQAAAELLAGNMTKHVFYAAPAAHCVSMPDAADPAVVPVLRRLDAAALARSLRSGSIAVTVGGLDLRFAVPPLAAAIVERIDGRRTVGRIADEVGMGDGTEGAERFRRQFRSLYDVLNGLNELLLRHADATE